MTFYIIVKMTPKNTIQITNPHGKYSTCTLISCQRSLLSCSGISCTDSLENGFCRAAVLKSDRIANFLSQHDIHLICHSLCHTHGRHSAGLGTGYATLGPRQGTHHIHTPLRNLWGDTHTQHDTQALTNHLFISAVNTQCTGSPKAGWVVSNKRSETEQVSQLVNEQITFPGQFIGITPSYLRRWGDK